MAFGKTWSYHKEKYMAVKKVNGTYAVVHCHGKDKEKRITKKPLSKEHAMKVHRAIQANKMRARALRG